MIKVSRYWHCLGRLKSIAVQLCLLIPVSLEAQSQNGVRYEDLKFETLAFDQPSSEVHTIMEQVKVLFLEDHSLPLVSLFARFRGGTSHFSREEQGAVTAVPMLLRSGGTTQLSPDSINTLLEHYAINVSFGRDGKSSFSSLNTLTDFLDESLSIWELLLTQPRFSREMVQVWQNQELDYLRRSERDPNTMAIRTFNQLMFGDHPTGWTLRPEDLELQHLEPEALRMIHSKIFCQENLILGVTGDTTWPDILPKIHKLIASIPLCKTNLKKIIPVPVTADPGIYLVPNGLPQTTIIIGKQSQVSLGEHNEYFASQIGNLILGGSGLNSRLSNRIRTQAGLSYSASSIWSTPTEPPGVLAAITQTKGNSTAAVITLILEVLQEIVEEPPNYKEVRDAISEISNGFVFNFQSSGQIVSRQMFYLAQDLPLNWLSTYLEKIQQVSVEEVHSTFSENLASNGSEDMIIVVVGDRSLFEAELKQLGKVYLIAPK